jgi:glycosyltransferase involved in cell wall biosynthesis
MGLKVCYFGAYNQNYPRNVILRKGLALNDVEVVECQVSSRIRAWKAAQMLLRRFLSLPRDFDAIIIAEVNQLFTPLAWLLARAIDKPLVADPFFSIYDSLVDDRKLAKPGSLRAQRYYYTDKLAMVLPDSVLADTRQHFIYYHTTFFVSTDKMTIIPIGADDEMFFPQSGQSSDDHFHVLFFGSYIPLHGIQTILKAAALLGHAHDVHFELVGSGQTYLRMRALANQLELENVRFEEKIPQARIPALVAQSNLVLGIFGDTAKAQRVIPHKVYQGLAMRKPVLTGDTPAIREFFEHGRHLFLVPMANPEALAEGILELKGDGALRNRLAEDGYKIFQEKFTPLQIGRKVKHVLEDVK